MPHCYLRYKFLLDSKRGAGSAKFWELGQLLIRHFRRTVGDICKGMTTDISSWCLRLCSVVLDWNFMPWSLPREAVIEASISLFLDTEKLTFETFHLMTNTYYFSLLVLFYISFSFYLQPYANRIAKYLKGKHRKIPVVYFANGGSCFIHKQIDMHGFWRSVHR